MRPEGFDAGGSLAQAERPHRDPGRLSVLRDLSPPLSDPGERLDHLLAAACRTFATRIAVSDSGGDFTFAQLDARANRLGRYFTARGIRPGDRVGVLLDRGFETYAALLGLSKAGATFVPLDANQPPERLAFILSDCAATCVVTLATHSDPLIPSAIPTIALDRATRDLSGLDEGPYQARKDPSDEDLCYVLYTSGTSGRPKGVAVGHRSLCNFVRVATASYGFGPGDRIYQGMSITFDFSIEELWVPLAAGATVVPNNAPGALFGEELADFIAARGVTGGCFVPTLLASIDCDLPGLRLLLLGGEACPPALVERWAAPGRVLLNTYGPTEATVTVTVGELRPGRPVTIGTPLPTCSIVILGERRTEAAPLGEAGEIGIAGVCIARGYLNRPDLTAEKFIPDFLDLPNNPSGRIYRTGDLGRINDRGEIEYLGRIDSQVKLRGYRIELGEIETVLLETPEIAQAAAAVREVAPGTPELVAFYSVRPGATPPDRLALIERLRERLPAYMTPAYLDHLPVMPTLVSDKTDRDRLPTPTSERIVFSRGEAGAPETATERVLCQALADTLGLATVSVDADFFEDYGAHSLLMARFCARVRAAAPGLGIAMRDVYGCGNIRRLARRLDAGPASPSPARAPVAAHEPTAMAYYGCGALQVLFYVVVGAATVGAAQLSLGWLVDALASPLVLFARAAACAAAYVVGASGLAVAAKWGLVGRAAPHVRPIWSLAYYRFWVVRQLVRSAPAMLFVGTPIFNLYLRALGARIGEGAVIASTNVPVLADLLSVGPGAVISKRAILLGAKAVGNRIHFGRIDIGEGAYVGEASVLDIGVSIGDFGQLGHASSLQTGQSVPAGMRYHGSPAEKTVTDFRMAGDLAMSRKRRMVSAALMVICAVLLAGAVEAADVAIGATVLDVEDVAAPRGFLNAVGAVLGPALLTSIGLYFGLLALGLAVVGLVPRLANRMLKPGKLYPLYGFHHAMQRLVETVSNARLFNLLFGDSILIDHYLRWIGWRIAGGPQTGSGFGTSQRHDNPFLCVIGPGTIASDGLQMINVSLSSAAFRLDECRVGADNFLGSDVHFIAGARVGDNCMLATKTMAPIDGPMRRNVGLLGSPPIEIPRAAARDVALISALSEDERSARVASKTRHNVMTIGLLMASHWFVEFIAIFVLALAAAVWGAENFPAMAIASGIAVMFDLAVLVLVDRASLGFRRAVPPLATVYDPAFWAVERYWKLSENELETLFAGTPLSPFFLRLLGVKVGRRIFNDGCGMSDRTLVQIGDGANLNARSFLQSHSLEEGVFKSDVIHIGAGASVGVGAFVHYGVDLGEGAVLDADAFLMKGEAAPPRSVWRGNPARMVA